MGEKDHIITATCDLFPDALVAMEAGYIDVTTIWDAYSHAQTMVKVLTAIAKGEDPACGKDGCLARGRVVTKTLSKTFHLFGQKITKTGTEQNNF